jgi:DNA polymerase III alpha subunit (gram-positive type)
MNLLWTDVETTGLQPVKHEVIDIAFCLTDREGKIIGEFQTLIKPVYPQFGEVEALRVNGYHTNRQQWDSAPDSFTAWTKIEQWWRALEIAERVYPAGWNPTFDLGFVRSDCAEAGIALYHHPLDLLSMVWFKLSHLERPHLADLCRLLTVTVAEREHTAIGDVRRCVQCYQRLTSAH